MLKGNENALLFPATTEMDWEKSKETGIQAHRDEDIVTTMVEHLPIILYRCDCLQKWRLAYISAGSTELMGYTPEELMVLSDHSYFNLMESSRREETYREILNGLQAGGRYSISYAAKTATGEYKQFNDSGRGIYSEDGELLAIEGMITAAPKPVVTYSPSPADASIQEKGSVTGVIYKLLIDQLGFSSFEYVSQGAEELWCVSPEQLYANAELRFAHIHPDDLARVRNEIGRYDTNTGELQTEFRVVHPESRVQKWLRVTASTRIEAGGALVRMGTSTDITEVKQAEEKLRLTDERYTYALRATNDAIYDYNIRTGEIWWGETYTSLFGHTHEDQITTVKEWAELIHPDEAEFVVKSLNKAMQLNEAHWSEEYRYLCKDGSYKYICDQGFIMYENDRPVRMLGAMKDISRRKADEEKIKRSNNLLKSIHFATNIMLRERFSDSAINTVLQSVGMSLEADRAYIIRNETDVAGAYTIGEQYTWSSPRAAANFIPDYFSDFYGLFLKEWNHWLSEGMLIKGYANQFGELLKNILEEQQVKSLIVAPILCHGNFWGFFGFEECKSERKWLNSEEHAMVALANTIGGIVEKQKTQEELKRSLAVLSATLEATADGVVVTDLGQDIINVNEKFFKIFNIPVVGSRVDTTPFIQHYIAKHVENADAYEEKLSSIYECPELASFDLLSFRDGRKVERYSQPLYVNQELSGLVWSYRDVTEREEREAVLKQKNIELGKTNAELDRFIYSASHELRAPLLSILGLVNITEAESAEPEVQQYCALMRKSVDRLDSFIQNIIHYSQNSRSNLNRELIIFEKIAQEALNSMKYLENAHKVTGRYNITQDFPFYSDKTSLNVVLCNLVSNAVKFHNLNQQGLYVDIDIKVDKEGAHIQVQDNGQGIDPQYQTRIFSMFFRVSGKASGSGLGLYVVKEIVDKLRGTIELESEPGTGTTFTIRLPHMNYRG